MDSAKKALIAAAVGELATGLALLLFPSLVSQLLFGTAIAGITLIVARVAGIALIGLGIACWPGPPRLGMLIYSAAVAVYMAFIGITGELAGILLWPAIVLHAVLTIMIILFRKSMVGKENA